MTKNRGELVTHAHEAIRLGSKSFAAASRLFDRTTRERAWLLYAWCRRCDDIADAQDHGGRLGDQSEAHTRLAAIRMLTDRSFEGEETGEPSFDALGVVAAETGLTHAMADDVIAGFALDADGWQPESEADLMRYCFHVAGAVGVMMAVVMGVPPQDDETLDRACDLGLAFQLANIARDIEEDHAAGRCYLPGEWLAELGIPREDLMAPEHRAGLVQIAARLAALAEIHERAARVGARQLAFRQRWAVLSAAGIYGSIARQVRRKGAKAWDSRVYTSRPAKLYFVAKAFIDAALPAPRLNAAPEWNRRLLAERARAA